MHSLFLLRLRRRHCEDRAAYGEQLLKKLEKHLDIKGLNERRFREFRRLYLVYPQLKEEVLGYVISGNAIRHSLTAEFTEPIRHLASAELQTIDNQPTEWRIPANKIFNRIPYTHLKSIVKIENPIKRAFYEMETIRGCWSVKELERQIASLYYERSGLSQNKEVLSAIVQCQATQLQPKDMLLILIHNTLLCRLTYSSLRYHYHILPNRVYRKDIDPPTTAINSFHLFVFKNCCILQHNLT